MKKVLATDVLVIGGGGAALRAAVEASRPGVRVDLVDKGKCGESGSSPVCLYGLSSTYNENDPPGRFAQDWVRTGNGINDRNLMREAISQSCRAVEELEAMGMEFRVARDGSRLLYRGAGHSVARGLTVKMPNFVSVLRAEAERRGVRFHERVMITRILQRGREVSGAVGVSQDGEVNVFGAKTVILAAGGANRLYRNVGSSVVDPKYRTTGDAFNLAFAAGAPLIDMEFTQFRECPPGAARFGGRYLNRLGERFMEKYDPVALEKAPRYRVVEAVYRETKAGRGPITWKVEGILEEEADIPFAQEYVRQEQWEVGIDFQRVLGGVRINERGETPIRGLFAAGESSGAIHGSDRMQGNSFLEILVFGAKAGGNAAALALRTGQPELDPAQVEEEVSRILCAGGPLDPAEVMKGIQATMWDRVGVIRDAAGLRDAARTFERLRREVIPRVSRENRFAALEASHLLRTSVIVTTAALAREETRSTHIRSDYPDTDPAWAKHVCIRRGGSEDEIVVSTVPVVVGEGALEHMNASRS